jgi:branched-chain amino acid transport system permease protein
MRSLLLGRDFGSENAAEFSILLATLTFLAADFVDKGAVGRRWRAVKSQRIASTAIGLTPHRANANAFAFSAAVAGVGGIAAALTFTYLDPLMFDLHAGILLVVATVVGGIGSFPGAVVGSAFIVGVPEVARNLPNVTDFLLGGAMVLVLLLLPKGLAPAIADVFSFLWRRERSRGSKPAPDVTKERMMKLALDLMPKAQQELRVRHLSVSFGGLEVLRRVSFNIPAGKTIGLIGPNGAGKTTLINVVSGFVDASSCDELSFGEADLRKAPPQDRLMRGIGRTFQHAELFDDLTVREILAVAASKRSYRPAAKDALKPEAIVERIILDLGLSGVADTHPEELPFGTRKVVDLARSLAAGAELIALDEPFSGLGQGESDELRAILAGMKQAGVSILIIDHAVQEVLDIADHIVVLNFGTVLMEGSATEVSNSKEVQEAYFGKSFTPEQVLENA